MIDEFGVSTDQLTERREVHLRKIPNKTKLVVAGLLALIIVLIIVSIIGWTQSLWLKHTSSPAVLVHYGDQTIGSPPVLPNDGPYVQWTFLHMNDVYELLPLDNGRKGGLARVATVRKKLLEENPHTYTFLAGDLVSPSALSQANVNGTELNGKQMIFGMNALGIDYMTFGNHEFDLKRNDLLQRMSESNFTWIGTNVFNLATTSMFGKSVPYKLLTVNNVRILIFSITTDMNMGGSTPYVTIVNSTSLKSFIQQFLSSLQIQYDVLIALTHVEVKTDIMLAENVPNISIIMGGHEHENYYLIRGQYNTPIFRADGNVFSVFIHRFAYNSNTKLLRLYSTLTRITPDIPDDNQTASVSNYWFSLGMNAFIHDGFQPNETITRLPDNVELDGRSSSIRYFPTLLSDLICKSILNETNATIGLYNTGAIRLDDVLTGAITQYDILRTVPFKNFVVKLNVTGKILSKVLTYGATLQGDGMFLSFCGVRSSDKNNWFLEVDGTTNIAENNNTYILATLDYTKNATDLNDISVVLLNTYEVIALAVIRYLKIVYPR
ncbi:unnamed protein product [Didymodactylos carnosus]|uniref:5'-nucleotidase n=1 Tax=Didymodactylos carnosus TaxID=1234261 RepID=A0A814LVQ6_9BILA|nr:unnamed protein product [Didymodactylos carnosus]CAF1303231.1 unnamed protein product [Didymodactylos carnosus]CAF3838183.1 unnamed protein product [Didymodactylos carnosus]CAF4109953.1 unnamed protein product [Didymodactylos carnosus]